MCGVFQVRENIAKNEKFEKKFKDGTEPIYIYKYMCLKPAPLRPESYHILFDYILG